MRPIHKELILLGLLVIFGLAFWLSTSTLLPNLRWEVSPLLLSGFVSIFLFLIIWGLVVMLAENTFYIILGWAITSFVGFAWIKDPAFLVASSLLFLAGIIGYFRSRGEIQNTLAGGLVRPLRKSIPLTITFISIAIATGAYLRAPREALEPDRVLPRAFFSNILKYSEPAIRAIDPAFARDKKFSDYVIDQIGPGGNRLPEDQKNAIIQASIERLEEERGIKITKDQKMEDIIYTTSIHFLERQSAIYSNVSPMAFAVLLFSVLRLIGLFVGWIVIGFVIILLRLMRKFGIVELRAVPTTIIVHSLS